MIINRKWAMPNKNTFKIKCISELIEKWIVEINPNEVVEPYSNTSKYGTITNDLNPEFNTMYNLDALDFLKLLKEDCYDFCLYDSPFSNRQISESYKNIGFIPEGNYTQSSFWSKQKNEIQRIMKKDSIVISFGWNTNGMGINRGFKIEEILLVAHGGAHNDTICTVERKIQ